MHRAVLTLLVGLFLYFMPGADNAWAPIVKKQQTVAADSGSATFISLIESEEWGTLSNILPVKVVDGQTIDPIPELNFLWGISAFAYWKDYEWASEHFVNQIEVGTGSQDFQSVMLTQLSAIFLLESHCHSKDWSGLELFSDLPNITEAASVMDKRQKNIRLTGQCLESSNFGKSLAAVLKNISNNKEPEFALLYEQSKHLLQLRSQPNQQAISTKNEAQPGSSTELDDLSIIQQHVGRCFTAPVTPDRSSLNHINIFVRVNRDGSVIEARIEDTSRYAYDRAFRSFANRAQQAIVLCSPLPISASNYELMKELVFQFAPTSLRRKNLNTQVSEKLTTVSAPELQKDINIPGPLYFNEIYFAPDSIRLNNEANIALQAQVSCLKQFPELTVAIEGHTDERHTRDFALALGEGRASAIRDYLIAKGIGPGRIKIISYGKNRPARRGSNIESWARQNRTLTVPILGGKPNWTKCRNFAENQTTQAASDAFQTASVPKSVQTSAELTAAQQQTEAERQKRLEVEAELAALKAEKAQQQATISADSQIPLIEVASQQKDEATALVYGRAKDNVGVADVLVNNKPVQIGSDGSFQTQLYIPPNGVVVEITAYDLKGNKASKTLSLNRSEAKDAAETRFAQLQPSLGKRGAINRNAIALIVGVEKYENLPAAPAIHADKDAEYFADFAHYKLGVPRNNIIKAINSDARRLDILKALAKVTQLSKENETEVFIFFAGHGLAADDGKDVFLIPYDGDTGSFLAETAITRSEIFQKVERIGPKSVTVFLDACYTGGTRSQDVTLVASKRPVRVEALNQSVPQGFTILSASASDETSMALEAAEHGMFSYFLMKGMEGDADANNDNQITMAEMRDYVKDKVIRQSNFKQTPELQGDADRVLVRFQ